MPLLHKKFDEILPNDICDRLGMDTIAQKSDRLVIATEQGRTLKLLMGMEKVPGIIRGYSHRRGAGPPGKALNKQQKRSLERFSVHSKGLGPEYDPL